MKGLRLYMILSGSLLLIYLIAQYYKPVPTDWTPSYLKEDKIPFGLYILHQQVQDVFPGAQVQTTRSPIYNTLKDKKFSRTTYFLVASAIKVDSVDYNQLKRFMENGNNVFIATFSIGKLLSNRLKLKSNSDFYVENKKSIPINFTNPSLKASWPYVFDKGLGDQYFSELDSTRAIVLGRNKNGQANFIKYTFGKGALYILPNPQLLTNYNLLHPAGADYAAKVLSCLPVPETLLWDELNTRGNRDDQSPLSVLFRYDALRWAYYLSLAGLLVFVFFEIKRRQRIIPVLSPLKNSSVEFVEVVGSVYYQQRNNHDISIKKISYLMEYIRTRYRLKTNDPDLEFEKALIIRSGIQEEMIRALFLIIKNIQNSSVVSDHQLIHLNKLIEQFYQQAQ